MFAGYVHNRIPPPAKRAGINQGCCTKLIDAIGFVNMARNSQNGLILLDKFANGLAAPVPSRTAGVQLRSPGRLMRDQNKVVFVSKPQNAFFKRPSKIILAPMAAHRQCPADADKLQIPARNTPAMKADVMLMQFSLDPRRITIARNCQNRLAEIGQGRNHMPGLLGPAEIRNISGHHDPVT